MNRIAGAGLLAALLALGGCGAPGPSTRVILLPQADGSSSAVVVKSKAGEQVLSQPYMRAQAAENAKAAPQVDRADAGQVQASFKPLFETVPPKPVRYTLFFQNGNTLLMPESQALLPVAIEEALKRSGAELVIIGHTDTLGAQEYNDELSLKRARLVVDMLADRRFPQSRIEAVGRGERELAVPTRDEVSEPRNRRVEILIR